MAKQKEKYNSGPSMLNNLRYTKLKYPQVTKAKFYLTELRRISGKTQTRLLVEALNYLVEKNPEYIRYRNELEQIWNERQNKQESLPKSLSTTHE